MTNYSKADTTAQWFQDNYPGAQINPDKVLWHSTEGTGWDPYGGGAKAPTYTCRWNFSAGRWEWRGHFPDERSCRALQNDAGGVETNKDHVIQVEIVGTCDPAQHRRWTTAGVQHVYTPELTATQIDGLADFCRDMKRRHGVPYRSLTFQAYPASYGQGNPNRMTFTEWRGFSGHCGHLHAPENDHGDPGDFPMARVLARAAQLDVPKDDNDMADITPAQMQDIARRTAALVAPMLTEQIKDLLTARVQSWLPADRGSVGVGVAMGASRTDAKVAAVAATDAADASIVTSEALPVVVQQLTELLSAVHDDTVVRQLTEIKATLDELIANTPAGPSAN